MHLSTFNNSSSKNISSSFLPSGRNLHTLNTSDRKADVISPLAEKSASPLTSPAAISTPTTPKYKPSGNQIFLHKSQKLLGLLTDTKNILGSYREINKERWHIQYPFVKPPASVGSQVFSKDDTGLKSFINDRTIKKALSSTETFNKFREQIHSKLYTPQLDMSSSQEINAKLNVLNLDLKKGDSSSAENVMEKLDKGSVATLLDERMVQSTKRIENLASRVADTSSKVLVAGDVNAGKSTFVNALLRREIMPVDQQPCTTLFCEVRDVQENSDREEVHAIKDLEKYDREDASTYTAIDFENLFDVISSGTEEYTQLKVYCKDKRDVQQSLLHNGVVDIALIDCPGLNRDTLKTTALFARQEEIDVIVFVVSAENHFTLSAKEFLSNASNEKAYIFIVVNRFDNIRNKEKCKRLVLDQIKEVSPRTYEHANDLVHFVTSTTILNEGEEISDSLTSLSPIDKQRIKDFDLLEESLRTFILKKRSKSKLDPAQHYLDNLIIDIGVLAEFNRAIAKADAEKTSKELREGEKDFEKLCNDEKHIGEKAERCVEDTCDNITRFTRKKLEEAISNIDQSIIDIEYPGLLYVWAFANDVRDAMLDEISKEVQASEEKAKNETMNCINGIQSMGDYLDGNPYEVNLDKMYKRSRSAIGVDISLADFVDLNFDKKVNDGLSIVGLSGCTVIAVATKLNALSSLWRVTSFIGLNNIRKIALPLTVLAGFGAVVFVLYDLERIITRNMARKIRQQLAQSQYIDNETSRIVRQGRKKMRLATENLRIRFRRAVEEEEKKRAATESVYVKSKEAVKFFEEILGKAEKMVDILGALGHDWDDLED